MAASCGGSEAATLNVIPDGAEESDIHLPESAAAEQLRVLRLPAPASTTPGPSPIFIRDQPGRYDGLFALAYPAKLPVAQVRIHARRLAGQAPVTPAPQ